MKKLYQAGFDRLVFIPPEKRFLINLGLLIVMILVSPSIPAVPLATTGYPGAKTFSAPVGATNFVSLGADPTGVVNAAPIFKTWYDGGGRNLYIPAGTYKFEYTYATRRGILVASDVRITGAGEGLVTINIVPPPRWGVLLADRWAISIITLSGATGCSVRLSGFHVVGPAMPSGGIWYEHVAASILFADSVKSPVPTEVIVDHVTWTGTIGCWQFFAGATTPTDFRLSNFQGRDQFQNISYYRSDNNYHRLHLQYGSLLKSGIAAADNPVTGQNAGHSIYTHANVNFFAVGVLFDNAENPGLSRYSLKLGGSGEVTAVPDYQTLVECTFNPEAGAIQLDGKRRTTIFRSSLVNITDAGISQFGTAGVDANDCEFKTSGIQFSANRTYNFRNCSFVKAGLYAFNTNVVVNIVGGQTHWTSADVAPGILFRGNTGTGIQLNFCDHDFWSEITDQDGNTCIFYIEAGTWEFTRCTFRGTWRTGADNAVFHILPDAEVQSVTLKDCTIAIGTKYIAKIQGPHGYDTFFTVNSPVGTAQVSDPDGEWTDRRIRLPQERP